MTSEGWGINGHTTWYTSPVSVVLWLRLVSGWGLEKRRSAPHYGPTRLGKEFALLTQVSVFRSCRTHTQNVEFSICVVLIGKYEHVMWGQVLLIDRNIIKFNLTSRVKSLQPPGVFTSAFAVVYADKPEGKHLATLYYPCTVSEVKTWPWLWIGISSQNF